jgi:hypothetical protein
MAVLKLLVAAVMVVVMLPHLDHLLMVDLVDRVVVLPDRRVAVLVLQVVVVLEMLVALHLDLVLVVVVVLLLLVLMVLQMVELVDLEQQIVIEREVQ